MTIVEHTPSESRAPLHRVLARIHTPAQRTATHRQRVDEEEVHPGAVVADQQGMLIRLLLLLPSWGCHGWFIFDLQAGAIAGLYASSVNDDQRVTIGQMDRQGENVINFP